MKTSKTAVFSVIHPANLQFFSSYLNSLVDQTEKDFDLLLVVDSIPNIEEYLHSFRDLLRIKILHRNGSVGSIREDAIAWLCEETYDFVIFSDSDDINAPDRVKSCCSALERYPIVVNDITPFMDEKRINWRGYWSSRFSKDFGFNAHDIDRFNFIGLGNSAVRKECVFKVQIPDNIVAIDWLLFYLWINHAGGVFDQQGLVAYRQHSSNLAGFNQVTQQKIHQILNTKLIHYNVLAYDFPYLKKYVAENEQKQLAIQDNLFLSRTIEKLNANQVNYFWWEETEYIHG